MSGEALVERVVAQARNRGFDVEGVWSAPGRVNLIGEHTDYNEGFVLPFAIEQRTAVAVSRRHDGIVSVSSRLADTAVEVSLDTLLSASLSGWSAYPLGVLWSFLDAGVDLGGFSGANFVIDSDVPIGAGLSSSAAIECAVAVAIRDLADTGHSLEQLAVLCQRAENVAVGAPTGIMDQTVSLGAEQGQALFIDCRHLSSEAVPLDLAGEDVVILVIDTGVKHSHAEGGYASRRASCELAASTLGVSALRDVDIQALNSRREELDDETFRRARHIVTENQRVHDTVGLLKTHGARAIGEMLNASHQSMSDDFEISCAELDLAVDVALEHGALGARMTGGGFGGAAIALVESEHYPLVAEQITQAFVAAGFHTPTTYPVYPSAGARREQF